MKPFSGFNDLPRCGVNALPFTLGRDPRQQSHNFAF
jgi:hypothetical protein